jgi:hypothetical protein
MRITIEIEDGAVKAVQSQGAGPGEVTNAGGPPAELVQLLGARPALAPQPAAAPDGAAVDVGGPPEELLRALGVRA